jgi:hypothetical protein
MVGASLQCDSSIVLAGVARERDLLDLSTVALMLMLREAAGWFVLVQDLNRSTLSILIDNFQKQTNNVVLSLIVDYDKQT